MGESSPITVTAMALGLLLLTSCGQKGALYLPEPTHQPNPAGITQTPDGQNTTSPGSHSRSSADATPPHQENPGRNSKGKTSTSSLTSTYP